MSQRVDSEHSFNREIGRTLGIDFGSKRIGIAVSDSRGSVASPLVVLQRSGNTDADHGAIARLVQDEEAVRIVVGMPTALSGQAGIAATNIRHETDQLRAVLADLEIVTWDERMTTAMASRAMTQAGVKAKDQRQQIDKYAAALILKGWLDQKRLEAGPVG